MRVDECKTVALVDVSRGRRRRLLQASERRLRAPGICNYLGRRLLLSNAETSRALGGDTDGLSVADSFIGAYVIPY